MGAINLVLRVGGWGEGRNDISHVRGGAKNLVLWGEDISHIQGYKYCPWGGGGGGGRGKNHKSHVQGGAINLVLGGGMMSREGPEE